MKTLKERLGYKLDVALVVDPVTVDSASTNAMENTAC
jgi:hypothetical protein